MKDIIIKGKAIRRELTILLGMFLISFLVNVYAIASYDDTSWNELITSIGFVVVLAIVLYIVTGTVRLIIAGLKQLLAKPQ